MKEEVISVGIDLGTSTMQLIFSKLIIENLAGIYLVPRHSISEKKIIYESDIEFTPMLSNNEIDIKTARRFIEEQYIKAQIKYSDVKTGAVIITGEAARRDNASNVINDLSGIAGDFVVATAGPDLESMLSGIGAGTNSISQDKDISIVNIDIGGGTSNISYFEKGKLKYATCLDIGGRLIKVNNSTNRITYIYHKIKELAQENNIEINEGEIVDVNKLKQITDIMSDILAEAINIKDKTNNLKNIYTNEVKPLNNNVIPRGITFSGGVGRCIYEFDNKNLFRFGDIGILLARSIVESIYFRNIKVFDAKETLRATVIGAGMHTTEISGSTISVDESRLPIKNIPILKIEDDEINNMDKVIEKKLKIYQTNESINDVAIAFTGKNISSFIDLQMISEKIVKGAKKIIDNNLTLIIVVENDIAKALGNAILYKLNGKSNVICIDGINTLSGDYIDIGKTLAEGQIVPVIIKTLIFNS